MPELTSKVTGHCDWLFSCVVEHSESQTLLAHFGLRPRGWRAPSFAFSKHSLRYLIDQGFDYDSSLMGDDIPYLLRDNSGALLELPTQWTLDDWPHYMHNRDFNYTIPISAPQRAL